MPKSKKSKTSETVDPREAAADRITDITMSLLNNIEPLVMWKYSSLRLLEAGWTEDDLRAQVDDLSLEEIAAEPQPTRRSKKGRK